jgi:hypothetical protein
MALTYNLYSCKIHAKPKHHGAIDTSNLRNPLTLYHFAAPVYPRLAVLNSCSVYKMTNETVPGRYYLLCRQRMAVN